jgi:hypothetical protein
MVGRPVLLSDPLALFSVVTNGLEGGMCWYLPIDRVIPGSDTVMGIWQLKRDLI